MSASRVELVESLKHDIVRARYEPGSRLPIVDLCEQFGVGLSDMHKALGELSADRFVTSDTQRGVRAASVSLTDLEDLTQARLGIEALAIRSAVEHSTDESDAFLVGAYYSLSRTPILQNGDTGRFTETYLERHRAFHEALVSACPSSWLKRVRSMMAVHAERYQQLSARHRDRSPTCRDQHKVIMDAVLERKSDLAVALLSDHIASAVARQSSALKDAL